MVERCHQVARPAFVVAVVLATWEEAAARVPEAVVCVVRQMK